MVVVCVLLPLLVIHLAVVSLKCVNVPVAFVTIVVEVILFAGDSNMVCLTLVQ